VDVSLHNAESIVENELENLAVKAVSLNNLPNYSFASNPRFVIADINFAMGATFQLAALKHNFATLHFLETNLYACRFDAAAALQKLVSCYAAVNILLNLQIIAAAQV
jgi:hypothetical protein